MIIAQAIIALLVKQLGRLLNAAFGWAAMLLFGKVPEDRQLTLSVISLGSVVWIVAVLGVLSPTVATFLLAFVTLPDWIDRTWIRLGMFAAAALLPLVIGLLSLRLYDPARRPRGVAGTIGAALRGYRTTLALAMALIMLTVFAPLLQL